MATKKTTTTTTTTSRPKSAGYIMRLLSYIAVCIGGVALFLAFLLGKLGVQASVFSAVQKLANALAWAIVSVLSFNYIKNRRKIWMWVVWTIAVIMVVVFLILG